MRRIQFPTFHKMTECEAFKVVLPDALIAAFGDGKMLEDVAQTLGRQIFLGPRPVLEAVEIYQQGGSVDF